MRTAEEYLESLRGKVWLIPKNFVEVLANPSFSGTQPNI